MRSNEELLAATYKAFNAREIDTVLAMLHPEVDWPNGMEGGRVHGRENVREYWTRQWAMSILMLSRCASRTTRMAGQWSRYIKWSGIWLEKHLWIRLFITCIRFRTVSSNGWTSGIDTADSRMAAVRVCN